MSNTYSRHGLLAAAAAIVALTPGLARAYDVAAAQAAANSLDCTLIVPFYWEIGGPAGDPIVSGSRGGLWTRNTQFDLASASKWIFGAYVMERYAGAPPADVLEGVRMLDGYTHFNLALCTVSQTVSQCQAAASAPYPDNGHEAAADGSFYYGGGQSQHVAADLLGLGSMTATQLTAEVDAKLQLGPSMEYQIPALGGGLHSSAADYAAFLQRLMKPRASGGYYLSDHLDTVGQVDTQPCVVSGCNPGGTIPFHYNQHYFIENNATGGTFPGGLVSLGAGDGSFSSPGAYGFYPWITADKQFYGVIARKGTALGFEQSMKCGWKIRAAFLGS